MKYPGTPTERKIMLYLVNAVNQFKKLKISHPSHTQDFIDGIHKCQYVLMHRIVQRKYCKYFPIYSQKEQKK